MGYVSLYRKWRPQTFEEVVGQDHITRTLKNAVKENRVSHAYLFAGPRGTGKTSVAKILAKALNCEKGPTPTPCNKCRFCQAITAGSSIDVVEIDAASNRGIDEIRDLREKVRFVPTEAGVKVYIVDEVHMLTTEAFNALLKMLEEPPPHVVFVLATTEPYKVLPTILSRCQRFDFRRISTTELINRLKKVAEAEKIAIDQASLSLITRDAHGSMRDAISTLDQLAAFTGKKVKLSDVTALLGMVESDLLFSMADVIGRKDTTKALQLVEEIADNGRDLRQFVKDLTEHFREIFIIQNADDPQRIISTTSEEFSRLEDQAGSFKPEWVIFMVTVLSGVLNEMRYSSDARLLLEVALVKMARAQEGDSVEALTKRVTELERRISEAAAGEQAARVFDRRSRGERLGSARAGQTPKPPGLDEPPAEPPASKKSTKPLTTNHQPPTTEGGVEAEKLKRAWEIVLKKVREKKISTYALILECEPVDIAGNIVTLEFNNQADFHKKEVEKGDNRTLVEETFAEVLGLPLKVKCTLSQAEQAGASSEPPAPSPEPRTVNNEHDVVETLKESFGAKVLEEKEEK